MYEENSQNINSYIFNHVEIARHRGRIIFLTYEAEAPKETLFLIGKGVTYDTGGADIKAGGVMQGMSRDKCGAAAVAGFMKVNCSSCKNNFLPKLFVYYL